MKIAIIGTRGIPNHHGGFEQFAEFFAVFLASKGHEVIVYNSNTHPFKKKTYKGVQIIHCFDPENIIGTLGQFIYDLNCILDSRKRRLDIILQLGYTSNSIWHRLLPKKPVIVTNMDGLEWKRSKYSKKVQKFLKFAERLAVKSSDYLISDSIGIQDYLETTFKIKSTYIAYGADVFNTPDINVLDQYGVEAYNFNMLIARLEPENNIETILDGVCKANKKEIFLVIGKHDVNKYGIYLKQKYKDFGYIKFVGGVYNLEHLNNLRYYSNLYFHGHSVGGTNPSLLEAMACNTLIVANNNIFNKAILGNDATYFETSEDIGFLIDTLSKKENESLLINNINKIHKEFNWEKINLDYLKLLENIIK